MGKRGTLASHRAPPSADVLTPARLLLHQVMKAGFEVVVLSNYTKKTYRRYLQDEMPLSLLRAVQIVSTEGEGDPR